MSTVKDELNNIGKLLKNEIRKNALPNKKTGNLDRSFEYHYSYINNEKFNIIISQMYYGKYLNKKTKYLDKAIDKVINKNITPIIDIMIDEMLEKLITKK